MKTYILDRIINKVKKYSENLEVKSILCEKPWIVFNDTGEKEVFIFRSDGTVLVTNNGEGVCTTWEWIPTNKSLVVKRIDSDNSIIMLHPEFVNNTILALELDGTNKYTFLIDENNKENFAPKTLSELKYYFLAIESMAVEAEQKRLKEAEKLKQQEKEGEERRKAQEAEDKRIAEENRRQKIILEKKAQRIVHNESINNQIIVFGVISVIISIIVVILIYILFNFDYKSFIYLIVVIVVFNLIINTKHVEYKRRKAAKEYIEAHPGDPVNNHLKQFL